VKFIAISKHLCKLNIKLIDALKDEEFLIDFLGISLFAELNYSPNFNNP
jgi:hypothetical protein